MADDYALSQDKDGTGLRHWHYADCRHADDAGHRTPFRCADDTERRRYHVAVASCFSIMRERLVICMPAG